MLKGYGISWKVYHLCFDVVALGPFVVSLSQIHVRYGFIFLSSESWVLVFMTFGQILGTKIPIILGLPFILRAYLVYQKNGMEMS